MPNPYRSIHGRRRGHGKGAKPKLSAEQLAQLKRDRESGMSFDALMAKYSVGVDTVRDAVRREEGPSLADFALPKTEVEHV